MWRSLAALALGLLALGAGGAARAQPPVWIVRDADSEMVLFGSVHVLPKGLDWRPPALTRALARADDVWLELPIDAETEAEVGRLAAQHGMLPPDRSLTDLLPPKAAEQLARVAQSYGASLPLLQHLEPWYAEVALAAAAYQRSGADTDSGVEKAIAAAAPPTAQRRAFETAAEQIALFDQAPLAEQVASLQETLQEMENEPDEFEAMVEAWMAGDLAGLNRLALEPLRAASPDLFRRVVTDRNVRWTEALHARLKGKGRSVVVVGVGHLIGPGGLPARLRALGYSVEGP